jgi:two-component system nitrogen regulation response regulator NtrX
VRELRNVVEQALIMSDKPVIGAEDLPPSDVRLQVVGEGPTLTARTLREFKDVAERRFIVSKLRENRWNVLQTAKAIDTPRSNLYKKIEQYEISREKDG